MFPSRVAAPVSRHDRSPEPEVTKVPANTTFGAVERIAPARPDAGPMLRSVGSDSPVRVDMSTFSSDDPITRASAEIRSPSRNRTMSPGTRSAAGIASGPPPHHRSSGSSAERAWTARSARYSWRKLNAPLTSMTTMIAMPSSGNPPTKASPAATHSMRAKKWTSCSKAAGPVWVLGASETDCGHLQQALRGLSIGEAIAAGHELGESSLMRRHRDPQRSRLPGIIPWCHGRASFAVFIARLVTQTNQGASRRECGGCPPLASLMGGSRFHHEDITSRQVNHVVARAAENEMTRDSAAPGSDDKQFGVDPEA